jgi:hypothetical protein
MDFQSRAATGQAHVQQLPLRASQLDALRQLSLRQSLVRDNLNNDWMKQVSGRVELIVSLLALFVLAACGAGGQSEGEDGGSATLPPTTGLLLSLTVAPAASSTIACSPVQYVATGHYSDNTQAIVTDRVVWQVDPADSLVAIAQANNGRVMGISAGSAVIYAWSGNVSSSAVLDVSSGELTDITVTPVSATLAVGGTQIYSATATCTNGTVDISKMNIWGSDNSAVARVTTPGAVTALAAGSSVISATAGAISASAVMNVK